MQWKIKIYFFMAEIFHGFPCIPVKCQWSWPCQLWSWRRVLSRGIRKSQVSALNSEPHLMNLQTDTSHLFHTSLMFSSNYIQIIKRINLGIFAMAGWTAHNNGCIKTKPRICMFITSYHKYIYIRRFYSEGYKPLSLSLSFPDILSMSLFHSVCHSFTAPVSPTRTCTHHFNVQTNVSIFKLKSLQVMAIMSISVRPSFYIVLAQK